MLRKINLKMLAAVLLGILLTAYAVSLAGGFSARAAAKTANAASVRDTRLRAEGRMAAYPGAQVVVGTDFAGTITRLLVEEKATVHRGDVLAEIRADEERAQLAEAKARMAESKADVTFYEFEADRVQRLFESHSVPRNQLDRAVRDRDAARARLQNALATAHRIEAILDKARIVAPIDGVVLLRDVQPGETVKVGQTLFTLADLSKVRVEAEVDEFDIGRVKVGSEAEVTAEGFANSWRARIEEIPNSVGPRKLKPQDPGKPEDTRVLLVKVALSEPTPLKLGQRVEVSLRP
jgi:RND family efflux transporter MFP subunit